LFDVWFDNSFSWDFVLRQDAHSNNPVTVEVKDHMQKAGLIPVEN